MKRLTSARLSASGSGPCPAGALRLFRFALDLTARLVGVGSVLSLRGLLPSPLVCFLVFRGLLLRRFLRLLGLDLLGLDGLGLRHGLAALVDGLGLLLGDHQLVLDPPAPLRDPGALADPPTQVVELRAADVAAGDHLEALHLRRVDRKGALHADPEGLLADGERLPRAAPLALEHDALEHLGPSPVALDYLEVHLDAVTRREGRNPLRLAPLDALDDAAHDLNPCVSIAAPGRQQAGKKPR